MASEVRAQERFHRDLFGALYDWRQAEARISDLSGDRSIAGLLGLDQMGHFGPSGCDLIIDALVEAGLSGPLWLGELGSGFGGALRYVLEGLRSRKHCVRFGLGLELVPEHCALASRIGRSLGSVATVLCADCRALPLPEHCLDALFAAGSASHFDSMTDVLHECARVLVPGGLLVFTEEVSIRRPGVAIGTSFQRLHPPGVFCSASLDERLGQLQRAGFAKVSVRDLSSWAIDLLSQRLKALRLFQGTAERLLGQGEVARVCDTLESALCEYQRGSIQPILVEARSSY